MSQIECIHLSHFYRITNLLQYIINGSFLSQGDETNGVEFLEDEFGLSTRLAIALLGE